MFAFNTSVCSNKRSCPFNFAHYIHLLIKLLMTVTHLKNRLLNPYSEDYYGDLDLKSIRKSELLAGIAQTSQKSQPKSRPTPSADKEA